MVDITSIRNRLQTKVFESLGSTILVQNIVSSSTVTNDYGDKTYTYDAGASEKGVPYNLMSNRSYEAFGDLRANETDMVLRYDTVTVMGSKITYNSKYYLVMQIEDFVLNDLSVAKLARLSEII